MSLFALCLGFFMVIIDVMIVNVALPNIATDLSGTISGLQWVVDGYTLMFTCLLLSAGTIGDRLGAKTAFLVGLALFVLTSIGCGLAPSILILTIFRFLQGMAAAFIVPTSMALINASYSNNKDRARAIGLWATMGATAGACGPILGGIITSLFSWRGVFFVNVPVGILAIILTWKYVASPASKAARGFDVSGQLAAIISLAALAFGLIEAGRFGWSSSIVVGAFVLFLMSTFIFLLIEYFSRSPIVPLSFFKSNIFSSTMMIGMLLNISGYGILFLMPLYLQQIRGYSVLMTGLALIPFVVFSPFSSYFSGRLVGIIGSRIPMIIGLSLGTLSYLSLLMIGKNTPAYAWLALSFAAMGIGTTFTMPAATIAVIQSAPTDSAGIASGLFNASRQLGSLIGVAVFGTLIMTSSSFIAGMRSSLLLAGLVYLLGVGLAFFAKK